MWIKEQHNEGSFYVKKHTTSPINISKALPNFLIFLVKTWEFLLYRSWVFLICAKSSLHFLFALFLHFVKKIYLRIFIFCPSPTLCFLSWPVAWFIIILAMILWLMQIFAAMGNYVICVELIMIIIILCKMSEQTGLRRGLSGIWSCGA